MCISICLVLIKTLGLKTSYFEGLGLIKYFQVHAKTLYVLQKHKI